MLIPTKASTRKGILLMLFAILLFTTMDALAAAAGLALAIPASKLHSNDKGLMRTPTRWVLNALRSIPELVWAALLLISAG